MPDSDRSADARLLFDVVKQAGELGRRMATMEVKRWTKPDGSQVTEGDLAINALFEKELKPQRDYAWLSEETPDDPVRLKSRRLWVIDPIDGTSAFIQHRNEWCVAAALVEDGRPVLAAVYRPIKDEFFTAVAGQGALLNGERLTIPDSGDLKGAHIAGNRKALSALDHAGIRGDNSGSLPLQMRLAAVAAGRIDGAVSIGKRNDWDLAAGELLVIEAGGAVSGTSGEGYIYNRADPWQQGLVAAGAKRHAALIANLRMP